MAKKNESFGEKALRYGKAYLFGGGIFGIGKEAYEDYEERRGQAKYLSSMDDAWESKDYERVIQIADAILKEDGIDKEIMRKATWRKAGGFFNYALQSAVPNVSFQDERNNKTLDLFEKSLGCYFDYGNKYGWGDDAIYMIMHIYDVLEEVVPARNCAIYLMDSEDRDIRTEALDVYNRNTNVILEEVTFTESVDYSKRKYVFLGKDIQKIGGTYQWIDDERVIDWIFTLDQMPSDLVFPFGRPQPGLYMAHPVLTDHYYPMETAEEKLFMEKVNEFCWLVQCLGAKEVSFHSNKGLSVSQGMESKRTIKGDVEVKKVSFKGEYGNTRKIDEDNAYAQKVELVQRFTPQHQVYCPNDLVWLESDPQWKMLVKQRMEGGIMEFNYKISSSETCRMSSNETNEVKANFEYIMVKINGNYDSSTDRTFSNSVETEWSIHVEFASMEELIEKTKTGNSISDKEQEYFNLLKESLENGEITPHERKILERVRETFGISEKRAEELEMMLNNSNPSNNINSNSRITAMIDCFVNNLSDTLININAGDNMYPRISEKTQQKMIYKFGMDRNEAVLFYRDSGVLLKKYTMALTDKGVYYIGDDKQMHSFMWKDVIDVRCISAVGKPELVDFYFQTTQCEHVIFMTEFGIIHKKEIDMYLESIRKGLKQMSITAKRWRNT